MSELVRKNSEAFFAARLGDETIVEVVADKKMLVFSGTAQFIWDSLDYDSELEDVARELSDAFGVELETCTVDAEAFVRQLEALGIVVRSSQQPNRP